MGLLDWFRDKPASKRRRRAPARERVVLVSPKGKRISFPAGANIQYHLLRGWRRA